MDDWKFEKLRQLVVVATPGPWEWRDGAMWSIPTGDAVLWPDNVRGGAKTLGEAMGACGPHAEGHSEANATFIAMASPDVIRGLLDDLASERAARQQAERALETALAMAARWPAEAARAEQAERERDDERQEVALKQAVLVNAWRERDEAADMRDHWLGALEGEKTARERAEAHIEELLRVMECPLGMEWQPPIFLCRTGDEAPSGEPAWHAEVVLDGFDIVETATTSAKANVKALARLCRVLLGRNSALEEENQALRASNEELVKGLAGLVRGALKESKP